MTNNKSKGRYTRNSILNPGFFITVIDITMEMVPIIIDKTLMHMKTLFSAIIFIQNKVHYK